MDTGDSLHRHAYAAQTSKAAGAYRTNQEDGDAVFRLSALPTHLKEFLEGGCKEMASRRVHGRMGVRGCELEQAIIAPVPSVSLQ